MRWSTGLALLAMALFVAGCEESGQALDSENDIIVRNSAEGDLWIEVDGTGTGRVDNNSIAETVWDNISDGRHTLRAYRDSGYTQFHCEVETDYLSDGEDFYWYLLENDRFEGTFAGDC